MARALSRYNITLSSFFQQQKVQLFPTVRANTPFQAEIEKYQISRKRVHIFRGVARGRMPSQNGIYEKSYCAQLLSSR